ncbi:hypothetical protein EYF80_004568 [Liparis tanakae]|uniref:Secreted protein n=1 Tax=Liparis tanakae TaxID=230148 RepID=A0A4Z2J6D8_9TELE|nr:hypothetical protein EYF80_004568 [Liparis tanakae]
MAADVLMMMMMMMMMKMMRELLMQYHQWPPGEIVIKAERCRSSRRANGSSSAWQERLLLFVTQEKGQYCYC